MSDETPLIRSMDESRERALVALTEPGGRVAEALAWLSAHAAAVEHVLCPWIRRVLGAGGLAEHRHATHDLVLRLRILDQVSAGRPIPPGASLRAVRDDLVDALVGYAATEDALVRDLLTHIPEADAERLAARYVDVVRRARTRPETSEAQPATPGSIRFGVDRIRNRVRDVLRARSVPAQRPPGTGPWLLARWRR